MESTGRPKRDMLSANADGGRRVQETTCARDRRGRAARLDPGSGSRVDQELLVVAERFVRLRAPSWRCTSLLKPRDDEELVISLESTGEIGRHGEVAAQADGRPPDSVVP